MFDILIIVINLYISWMQYNLSVEYFCLKFLYWLAAAPSFFNNFMCFFFSCMWKIKSVNL